MSANGWLQIFIFMFLILAVTKPLGIYMWRVFETAAHEVVVGISARQWAGGEARFRVDRKLNTLQNGDIADLQRHFTNERGCPCHVPGDNYGGVICIIGVGDLGEDHEDGADDD